MVRVLGGVASLVALTAFTWPSGHEAQARRPAPVPVKTTAVVTPAKPAPVLRAVGVKKVVASDNPVALAVQGQGLVPGVTATMSSLNEIVAFGPTSIADVTPTGFTLTATFARPGVYQLTIQTPDGRRSNTLPISVVAR